MAITRYNQRRIFQNSNRQYKLSPIFKKRGLKNTTQFTTAELTYPSPEELEGIQEESRVWGVGTKYFNLAKEFYGDEQYWWIIAWYNLRPLETDFKPGDVVYIPLPLEEILSAFEII